MAKENSLWDNRYVNLNYIALEVEIPMSSIKDKIESHQSLFEGKMSLYEDLMLLAESDCEQSSIDNVVSDYLVVLSDLRNRKKTLLPLVQVRMIAKSQ